MQSPPVRIGTRGSKLALVQARWTQARVTELLGEPEARRDLVAPLVILSTAGDRIQDRRLLEAGGKALFVKEIEQALLEGRIDVAVHSGKDLPAEGPEGLVLAAFPEREDPRDALLTPGGLEVEDLPPAARIGTASLRRGAQLLARRADLQIELLRGNVDTRLQKLSAGDFDAIVLALAGLKRLGLAEGRPMSLLDPVAAPPAPSQGALAIQARSEDASSPILRALDHAPTRTAIAAERGALEALEGSCRTAMGAYARFDGDALLLTVEALIPDGSARFRREGRLEAPDPLAAFALGLELGHAVRDEGGDRLEWMG